jgi:hypothetical protein
MRTFLFLSIFLITSMLLAQPPISNKGNRNQTYPNVTAVNPDVAALVNEVDTLLLESNIRWMQDLGIRNALSSEALLTQNWLIDWFESFGFDVYVHYFPTPLTGDTLNAGNVVAIQWGYRISK